jgi:hypothetical protein
MNEAVNNIVGGIQSTLHTIKNDFSAASSAVKGGIFEHLGFKGGASFMFSNMDTRSQVAAGGILAGGVALTAWGVHKMFDEEEDRHVNSITSQLP